MLPYRKGVGDILRVARKAAHEGDLEKALGLIADVVVDIGARGPARARIFTNADLDELTLELGRIHTLPARGVGTGVVIMATVLSKTAGHSRVIQELIAAESASEITVLVSGVHHELDADALAQFMPQKVNVRLAPRGGLALTTKWLQKQIAELAPARTYLFNHPFDASIIAACQPELTGSLYFYHHNDQTLTLGAHIPHAVHIDFNAKGFFNCRDAEKVADNVVWPLSSAVPQPIWRPRLNWNERCLTTACVGTNERFETRDILQPMPYAMGYEEVVATVLGASGGRHVHVGELSVEMRDRVENRLNQAGLDIHRFIYRPNAPSTVSALMAYEVDLYLGSFPFGSGDALVDAMAAGVPTLLHDNYRSIFFCDAPESYPGSRSWRKLAELVEALKETTPELLADESARARAFFDAQHRPELFATAVIETVAGARRVPPVKPRHSLDNWQNYLDERVAYSGTTAEVMAVPSAQATRAELWRIERAASSPMPLTVIDVSQEVYAGYEVMYHVDRALKGLNYIEIWGWAFGDPDITSIVVSHNGHPATVCYPNIDRPDVANAFPKRRVLAAGFFATWRWAEERPPPDRVVLRFFAGASLAASVNLALQSSVPDVSP